MPYEEDYPEGDRETRIDDWFRLGAAAVLMLVGMFTMFMTLYILMGP